jgi:hypothetical protein
MPTNDAYSIADELEVGTLAVVHEIALEYVCYVDFTPDGAAMLIGSWQSGYCILFAHVWKTKSLT